MKKPVKAETTVNPPLLRSGMQNACTYSDTGCVGGSICAADAAAYIPVNTDAKVSTTQKDHPVGWSFCVVETTGIEPVTPCMSSKYSNQLSYASVCRVGLL